MKKKVFVIYFLLVVQFIFAQSSAESIVTKFFSTYANNKEKAVKELYATNVWTETNKEVIENVIKAVNDLTVSTVGSYYGHEIVSIKNLTASFSIVHTIAKYDRQPIRFVFKLYKPKDKWMLFQLMIDDKIEESVIDEKKK